ncbi:MAG: M15 family metallopeptidase, partial [Actinomycetota bacterium]
MRFAAAPLLAIVFVLVITAPPAVATGGEGETWPTFTESSGCGAQRMSTPTNHYSGWLSTKAILRGEYGGMFGRTVQAVLDDMVKWRIPGSSEFLAVHPRLLPALELVERSLADEIDDGNRYRITDKWTYSAAARTIAGGTRISRHTYGTAFDVNAHRNPYSRSNDLRSDIPDWWLDSFIDAGFCWGGHWIGVKDTMHFSWQGPAFSGETSLAPFYAPLTEPIAFADRAVSVPVEPQNTNGLLTTVLTDAATNGAVDVVRVRRDGDAVIVDASVASLRHSACSLRSSIVSRIGQDAADAHTIGFGDWDGRGGNDLWLVSDVNGHVELSVRWTFGGFSAETSALTSVPAPAVDAWITSADYDVDGELDLFIVEDGTLTIWAIDPDTGASSPLFEGAIPFPDAEHFTLGDTDLDHVPDLWAVGGGEVLVALG